MIHASVLLDCYEIPRWGIQYEQYDLIPSCTPYVRALAKYIESRRSDEGKNMFYGGVLLYDGTTVVVEATEMSS
jgi:hypothetical protein